MKILLMRHGFSGNQLLGKDKNSPEDLARPLEPEGTQDVENLAAWLLDNDMVPSAIRASTVKRAKQTAKILGDAFGMRPIMDDNLYPTKPVEQVIRNLAADKAQHRVMLITHSNTIQEALRALNFLDVDYVDPIACAEMRVLKVRRKDGAWKESRRIMPTDLGSENDLY